MPDTQSLELCESWVMVAELSHLTRGYWTHAFSDILSDIGSVPCLYCNVCRPLVQSHRLAQAVVSKNPWQHKIVGQGQALTVEAI